MAENEALFRAVNERLRERAPRKVEPEGRVAFLCECAEVECRERIALTIADYERVRGDPTQFVVRSGHVLPEIEHVVAAVDDYAIVRKRGDAAAVAEELDPRA